MLRLLREHQLAATFCKAKTNATEVCVAVPFWGTGAIAALRLDDGTPIRVICNLGHPGCNPDIIQKVRELGIPIRTHPRLHAKIYATDGLAIVGSSNVSTNGLLIEGAAAKGWIEANVCSDSRAFVSEVLTLFQTIWDDPETKSVRKADIETAKKERANWRIPFRGPGRKTLLAACRQRPNEFRSVYVAVYGEGLGPEGRRLLREVKNGALPPKPGLSTSDFRKAWGYQIEGIPEEAWLIDLNCIGKPRYGGCAKATGFRLKAEGETDLTLAIPGVVTLSKTGEKFPVSAEEKALLARSAPRLIKLDGLLPLPEAIKIIDRVR